MQYVWSISRALRLSKKRGTKSVAEAEQMETLDVEMEGGGCGTDTEREEEDDSVTELLRDRFRLSTISIAEAEAKKNGLEISEPMMACVADLAFKYAEQLGKDFELFAQHAGRKTVNMDDVVLSAHRNEHLTTLLRSFSNDLKAKEPQSERKRKKASKREDKASNVVHILEL